MSHNRTALVFSIYEKMRRATTAHPEISNREIGRFLNISPSTVRKHRPKSGHLEHVSANGSEQGLDREQI